jgi:two-component system sensor histidine kinase RegB
MQRPATAEALAGSLGEPFIDLSTSGLPATALRTLVRLRWGLILGQLFAVIFTARAVNQPVQWLPIAALIAFQVLSNAFTRLVHCRARVFARPALLAGLLALDVGCLTLIIHWSGGPANPFSSLFVIHALVAVVVLPPRYRAPFAGMACLAYLAVFLLATGGSLQAPAIDRIGAEMHHAVAGHLLGMWISLALTIAAVTLFGGQLLHQLRDKERALARAVAEAAEANRVASLTSFAAGAAHELSTPLSTIAVVVGELSRRAPAAPRDELLMRDLDLIRGEVSRCRRIIQSLHYDLDKTTAPPGAPFDREIREALTLLLGEQLMSRVRFTADPETSADGIPVRGLAHAAAALFRNALEASSPGQSIDFRVRERGDRLQLSIIDRGRGIAPEDLTRVEEPFFSRRPDGRGTGLGLFLARVICNQIGAALTLRSEPGRGTEATIVVPRLRPPARLTAT